MFLEKLLAYIHTELFGRHMKKPSTDQIPKLPQITIILSLLLMVACQTRFITAPDLLHPASMSPKVGVNPNQKYQEVMKFSFPFYRGKKPTIALQEKLIEAVKGSERKAIKGIEVNIEFVSWFYIGVLLKGSVIETP